MVPETYNTKQEFFVNVCKSCNWWCNAFRQALLEGDCDQAVALFATGNVNLYTPFANVKGELFYPVHCAVLGNNCDLLRFLVDEQCCPIKSVRVNSSSSSSSSSGKGGSSSSSGRHHPTATSHTPIVTSRGRSLLGMAMEQDNLDIVRYLLVEKGVDSAAEPDVTRESLGRVLVQALLRLPTTTTTSTTAATAVSREGDGYAATAAFWADDPDDDSSLVLSAPPPPSAPLAEHYHDQPQQQQQQRTISEEARDFGAVPIVGSTTTGGRSRRGDLTVMEGTTTAAAAATTTTNDECKCADLVLYSVQSADCQITYHMFWPFPPSSNRHRRQHCLSFF
jgi:hypothetical protein